MDRETAPEKSLQPSFPSILKASQPVLSLLTGKWRDQWHRGVTRMRFVGWEDVGMCYNPVLNADLAAIGSSSRGKGAGDSPPETRKPGSTRPCGRGSWGRSGGQGSGPEKQPNNLPRNSCGVVGMAELRSV
jgi:hypothetical protein